jgi:LPXTG-motif cell wall-anchored protein
MINIFAHAGHQHGGNIEGALVLAIAGAMIAGIFYLKRKKK